MKKNIIRISFALASAFLVLSSVANLSVNSRKQIVASSSELTLPTGASFEMLNETQLKISPEGGIRFRARVNEEARSFLLEDGKERSLHFVITSSAIFQIATDRIASIEGDDAKYNNYYDCFLGPNATQNRYVVDVPQNKLVKDAKGNYFANVCLTDIQPSNRKVDFVALSYMQEGRDCTASNLVWAKEERNGVIIRPVTKPTNLYDLVNEKATSGSKIAVDDDEEISYLDLVMNEAYSGTAYSSWYATTEDYPAVFPDDATEEEKQTFQNAVREVVDDSTPVGEEPKSVHIVNQSAVSDQNKKDTLHNAFAHNDRFMYRVGNANAFNVSKIFPSEEFYSNVEISFEKTVGSNLTYTISEGDYNEKTIKFDGTGIGKLTAKVAESNIEKSVFLEVIDAYNATKTNVVSAENQDVVLLEDVKYYTNSNIQANLNNKYNVANGHTLHGNGFKFEAAYDAVSTDFGSGFIELNNGNLDNVRVIAPIFDNAFVYFNQYPSGIKYYEQIRNAVKIAGTSVVRNSYISGGRAAVSVAGNATIENTTINGGTFANIEHSSGSMTLEDVTTIQEPTITKTGKTVIGAGIYIATSANAVNPEFTLKGKLSQHNWLNSERTEYMPSVVRSFVNGALSKTEFQHQVDSKTSINCGIIIANKENNSILEPVYSDLRTNKEQIPYSQVKQANAYVYSYNNSKGTDASLLSHGEYEPSAYNPVAPKLEYAPVSNPVGYKETYKISYDAAKAKTIYSDVVELDVGVTSYTFDLTTLSVMKYGEKLPISFKKDGVAISGDSLTFTSTSTISLSIEAVDKFFYDVRGNLIEGLNRIQTFTFDISVNMVAIDKPTLVSSKYGSGLTVANNENWTCALPALVGLTVRYYSYHQGGYVDLALSSLTPATEGQQNGTNNTWTYDDPNEDFSLTVTGGVVNKTIKAMPVVCDDKLYFVSSTSDGLVSPKTTSRAITLTYEFKAKGTAPLSWNHQWSNYPQPKDGDTVYNYNSFCAGTLKSQKYSSSSFPCFAADTLITLADGRNVAVKDLTGNEQILAWDFVKGEYVSESIVFLVNHGRDNYLVTELCFSDGTTLKIIGEHGVFDITENRFVSITSDDFQDYVGHKFAKMDGVGVEEVTLVSGVNYYQETESYSLASSHALNAIAGGMLTVQPPVKFYSYLEVGEGMRYDVETLAADIATYGLYTYEDFADYVSEEIFDSFNAAYLKIAVGKGYFTFDYILELIETYGQWFTK